jgi:L-malate glycosyltransferase
VRTILHSVGATIGGFTLWLILHAALLALWLIPRGKKRAADGPFRVLVTGRVDSSNWCMAHLTPLARTRNISELLLVVDGKVKGAPAARQFPVPAWIGWVKPRAIARSFWAFRIALREKPDIIMAYSFFPPGVFALFGARLCGAASILQLPGGPLEIEWGAIGMEEPFMPRFLTRRLAPLCHKVCNYFDTIIVRGRKARSYTRQHCRPGGIDVISGGVAPERFHLNGQSRIVDVAFVGRVVPIKQPDHLCQVIHRVVSNRPLLRVVIAGKGPLLAMMQHQVAEMGLANNVRFVGHVERVERLLTRTRIFLLTSQSEGLSIAMVEAMMAGAVPVVPDVGDLAELIVNGRTGWLVRPGDFDEYAERICALLEDPRLWEEMSRNARELVLRENAVEAVAQRWQGILARSVNQSLAE